MTITTYLGSLFEQASFTAAKSLWMSGFCNSLGSVVSTAAALSISISALFYLQMDFCFSGLTGAAGSHH